MECLSRAFVAAARRVLAADVSLLGTVALRGSGFIAEAKEAPGVELVEVFPTNREALPEVIADRLRASRARTDGLLH
jgi:nucleoside-triphosphatase THEP1